jgi:hypothetical protein
VGLAGDKIRLCITGTLLEPEKIQYLTLSHCWGLDNLKSQEHGNVDPAARDQVQEVASFVMPMLKVDNLQQMREEIPFDTLSRTFQEAIFITRRLGFRYLWIDSLCIIQGNAEDWAKESVMMSSVYSGSRLNIAATSARNGTEGCFRDRRPVSVQPCKVGIRTKKNMARESITVSKTSSGRTDWKTPLCVSVAGSFKNEF